MEEEATQPGTFSSFALHAPFAPFAPAPCSSTPLIHVIPPSYEVSATDIDDLEATQLIVDPRRLGMGGSGLNDEDLADICCILHPASLPAYRAAAHIHEDTPQYTISTESDNVQIRERHNGNFEDCETFDLAAAGLKPCDIALRLSANLKDPLGGFHFGRNKQRCDFLIGRDEKSRRVSNIHFRIYINEYGIIMLEDQSTNGTAVDGTLLRGKEKENGHDYRHTLEQGSVIMVIMMPPEVDYRFYVRIPHRDEEAELAYQRNLTAYFLRLNNIKQENAARLAATNAGVEFKRDPVCGSNEYFGAFTDTMQPNLFPTTGPGTPNPSSLSSGRHIREWRGGAKYNKVGYIGKGAFAVVYKLTAKFDGVPYAAKELEKRRFMKNGVLDQKVDMEMKIMRSIKHVS
jgi:FHA domain